MICLLLSIAIFLSPSHPMLNERADEVCPCHIRSDEVQQIIDQMVSVGKDLAAPQIGIQKRIIVVDKVAYIDPEILWKSEEIVSGFEECVSTLPICGVVPRAKKILMRAYDREGNVFTREFEESTARIFQHEIDHLDGIRFSDRIPLEDKNGPAL